MKNQFFTFALLIECIILVYAGLSENTCGEFCDDCAELTGECRTCIPGRWGPICNRVCSDQNCLDNVCGRTTGVCLYGCNEGWYFDESRCRKCASNCLRCLNNRDCIACKGAKFGVECELDCDAFCEVCEQKYSRQGSGLFGSYGTYYRISRCTRCTNGVYGTAGCFYDCNACIDGLCSKNNCTLGCKDGYYNYQSRLCVFCFPGCESCDQWSKSNKRCLTCPKGKWGDLCDSDCDRSCDHGMCDLRTGECRCREGFYLHTDGVCYKCPDNCITCNTSSQCYKCVEGTYGQTCEKQCRPDSGCLTCKADGVTCTSCAPDHYLVHPRCYSCGEGCSKCWWMKMSQIAECTGCKEGYYKDVIEKRPITKCYKCPDGCSECNVHGQCFSCLGGYTLFHHRCCPDTCKACTTVNECTACVDGYFGVACSEKCHETCSKCSSIDRCDSCKVGFHNADNAGNRCECSPSECAYDSCEACKRPEWYVRDKSCCECHYCKDKSCDRTGQCMQGCPSQGRFGLKCDLFCSDFFSDCLECVGDQIATVACKACKTGWNLHKNQCMACPTNCANQTCDSTYKCTEGCALGWMGDTCDVKCGAECKFRCHQDGCPECQYGLYGERCESRCHDNCDVKYSNASVCDKQGYCLNCKPGWWGKKCYSVCGEGCKHEVCARDDGVCLNGCYGNYYGDSCEQKRGNTGGGGSIHFKWSFTTLAVLAVLTLNSCSFSQTEYIS